MIYIFFGQGPINYLRITVSDGSSRRVRGVQNAYKPRNLMTTLDPSFTTLPAPHFRLVIQNDREQVPKINIRPIRWNKMKLDVFRGLQIIPESKRQPESRTKSNPYLPHQKVTEPFHSTRTNQDVERRGTSEVRHHVLLDILFGDSSALGGKESENYHQRVNTHMFSLSSTPLATFS